MTDLRLEVMNSKKYALAPVSGEARAPKQKKTEPDYDVLKMLGAATTYLQEKPQTRQETTDKELEVQCMYQVKICQQDLLVVSEVAGTFLDTVDDAFYYFQSRSMKFAKDRLTLSTPSLNPMKHLMAFLGTTLTTAKRKHSEFADACDKAIDSIKPSAVTCASKTSECYNTWIWYILLAMAIIVLSCIIYFSDNRIAAIILVPVVALILVGFYRSATSAKRLNTSFKMFGAKLDSLLEYACTMKVRMARIHTTIEHLAAQTDSIIRAIEAKDTTWLQDAMDRFEGILTTADGTNRKCFRDMIQNLKD